MCKKKQFKYCPSEIDECMRPLMMKIEIKEGQRSPTVTSYSLVINNEIVLENTGLHNCTEFLLENYGEFAKSELNAGDKN